MKLYLVRHAIAEDLADNEDDSLRPLTEKGREKMKRIAAALKDLGAEKIYACCTHALLQEKGLKALDNSPIEELVITDTVENPLVFEHPKVKVVSVSHIFAQAVKIIHDRDSLSSLFEQINPNIS